MLRLADFRRRAAFKFNNGLFEFSLTLPVRCRRLAAKGTARPAVNRGGSKHAWTS